MSNNIYDILKKMASLEQPKKSLTEGKKVCSDCGKAKCSCVKESAKPDYIDLDDDGNKKESMKKAAKDKSKGAIAEAVARVEQQLAEKYMGFKKTVAAIEKGGSAENPEAVAAAIGRKKYGKAKFQKAAAAGKKLGEGEMDEAVRGTYLGRQGYRAPQTQDERDAVASNIKYNRAQNRADTRVSGYGNRIAPQRGVASADTGGARGSAVNVDQSGEVTDFQPKIDNIDPQARGYRGAFTLGKRSQGKGVAEDSLTPKQQKFAKLAPPPDKITYADKIAGAKKTNEGWEEMQDYLKKKKGPQSQGGAGKKAGTRYGGSAQADDAEEQDGEGKPVEKKKGRPKGTGSGAKFNFNKAKK